MAFRSLTLLLDDIAYILDDVALLSKVAAKKTSGLLGDDLALNAEQVAGVRAARELPVVWAVTKGSFRNKLIIVPAALLLSAFLPGLIIPLLMIGGGYLCYEGFEKVFHRYTHRDHHEALPKDLETDLVALERDKIKGAIRTDFILSTEIIVVTLGTVAGAAFASQVLVLVGIAIVMTVGVYGLVAGIVKLDDGGLALTMKKGKALFARGQRSAGRLILSAAPYLMKGLSIAGTAAMFTVGGGILVHGIGVLENVRHEVSLAIAGLPGVEILFDAVAGIIFGAILLGVISLGDRIRRSVARHGTAE